nr:MAG TPA: tail protein [Caudoviricetes sp.]
MVRKLAEATGSISISMRGEKGESGDTGNGIKSTEVTYQIGSSGTTPPTDGVWDTKIPNITDKKPYLWTRTIFKYTNGTDSTSFSVATRGTKGALMREHDEFESGSYKYLSGSGAEAYIDVVCVNGKWYQCTKTYDNATSSPSLTDGHWTEMSNYKSIATHLLLAENATINMLGTNQINLFNPTDTTTDRKMYGSFRVVKDVNDWSLWLGGGTGDSASFAVRRNGYLKATNADISGRIDATSGSIAGFNIYKNSIGSVENDENMSLSNDCLQFMNRAYLHGEGYFVTCGNYLGTGLRINSVTSAYNDLSTGIWILIDAGTSTPSGKMCTALDLHTRWADQAGSFDITNPYEGNHAIVIRGGDVIGLRPSFVRLAASDSLTEYHHTVECYNTSAITLDLPSSPKYGQCYTIIQRGSRVTFSSDKGIYDVRRASSATTWYSDTRSQVSWLWYNGSQWIVCYTTN